MGMLTPVVVMLILFPSAVIRAFVLSKLWAWYISPLFALQHLPTANAFGLALMANFLGGAVSRPESKKPWFDILRYLLNPFFVLLIGWIGTWFL